MHGLGTDHGTPAPVAGEEREGDVAGIALTEVRRFQRSRVDGGCRGVRLDLPERVRVADREVEATVRRRPAGDGEVRLVTLDVEGLAVHKPDPYAVVAVLARRQGGGEVGLARPRGAWVG